MVLEMPSYPDRSKIAPFVSHQSSPGETAATTTNPIHGPQDDATLPSPTTARTTPHLQRWNHPRSNIARVLGTFWCFIILGANDAAYGALIPYLEEYYDVDYLTISLVFLSPIVGYTASAVTNNMLHMKVGQRGIAFLVSILHIVAYVIISIHPPFPALVVVYIFAGYGNGLADSGWNAWIGDMANANEVLGFLHGMYGLGACIAPLIATAIVTQAGWPWYTFYYFLVGASVIELFFLTGSFWAATGAVYRAQHADITLEHDQSTSPENVSQSPSGTSTPVNHEPVALSADVKPRTWKERYQRATSFLDYSFTEPRPKPKPAPTSRFSAYMNTINPLSNSRSNTALAVKNRVTVLAAVFLLFYVGAEVSIGGWIVTFMLRVRHGTPFASGLTSTGFWLGVTVGRFILGFVTGRLFPTEKHAITCYLTICLVLQLLFWLIPSFTVSAVMVGLLGFFVAPMFPAAVVVMTKLLPKRLHVAAVGFAAAVGASGATILPFAVGAIANSKGVYVLQPVVLALFAAQLMIWLCIPRMRKQRMS
ncbi:hypothetical protein H2198_007139 [Neophaeococcomyces mojaviensis]|uniref:Uncharacterized protein n=1 Tax=Neophaeococcomyces mojaviensis TaxID=3383035 RepID=A0ACC3A0T8_9EURO|nr:hypothetical protein H2198_007139 [Knufia sp. JES_112]